jgi:hypothetical protein
VLDRLGAVVVVVDMDCWYILYGVGFDPGSGHHAYIHSPLAFTISESSENIHHSSTAV